MARETDSGDDLYDFATDPKPLQAARPAVRAQSSAPKVIGYQRDTRSDKFDPERLRNTYAPLALLSGGLLIEVAMAWWQSGPGALTSVGFELAVGTIMMLLVFRWCAARRGFGFGNWGHAVLKVMAIATAPSAAMDLLSSLIAVGPWSSFFLISLILLIALWIAGFCFYFALIGYFFELDQDDTWFCVIALFLVGVAVSVASAFMVA